RCAISSWRSGLESAGVSCAFTLWEPNNTLTLAEDNNRGATPTEVAVKNATSILLWRKLLARRAWRAITLLPVGDVAAYLGASEATILSKRGSPRSGSQIGSRRSWP